MIEKTQTTEDGLLEFSFPDEQEHGNKGTKHVVPEGEKKEADGEGKPKIEVQDDTPARDRGRKPAKRAPEEVTDEELAQYSESVQKRIKEFTRGYHDQRRAREAAEREREETLRYAQSIMEQNKQLSAQLSQGEKLFLEQAKKTAEAEVSAAEREYQDAYEAGDAQKLTAAQRKLTGAQVTLDRVTNYRPQVPAQPVQNSQDGYNAPQQPTQKFVPDRRAAEWQKENPWFGEDEEMTSFALGVHEKLVKEGVSPLTEEYYERVNARMRKVFPDQFEDTDSDPPPPKTEKRAASPVAPATRSTGPKKIRLTQTQVAIAKRLGVSVEQYAKQVAALENRNG